MSEKVKNSEVETLLKELTEEEIVVVSGGTTETDLVAITSTP